MPGFATHYLFGYDSLKRYRRSNFKEVLKQHQHAYCTGLQGPDIFFYSPYSFTGNKKRLGSVMHVYETGAFLRNLIRAVLQLRGEEQQIGISYLAGFLGHYSLDTTCHPYIYYASGYLDKENPYFGKHVDLEMDIDRLLFHEMMGKKLIDFQPGKAVALTRKEAACIGRLLDYSCKKTYPYISSGMGKMAQTLWTFRWMNIMLKDRSGMKKKLVQAGEQAVLGHPIVSPLLVTEEKEAQWEDPLNMRHQEWKNPWDQEQTSTESFLDLFHRAQKYYITLLEMLDCMYAGTDIHQKLYQAIGNRSYHSGLDCEFPERRIL